MTDRESYPLFDRPAARFDGPDYDHAMDHARLAGQILRVFECMRDGRWRTVEEISAITKDPQPSVSAQLRHLRKPKFGQHLVEKRTRGDRAHGLFEYHLTVTAPGSHRCNGVTETTA